MKFEISDEYDGATYLTIKKLKAVSGSTCFSHDLINDLIKSGYLETIKVEFDNETYYFKLHIREGIEATAEIDIVPKSPPQKLQQAVERVISDKMELYRSVSQIIRAIQ